MDDREPDAERRPWRTDHEWNHLRERIAIGDPPRSESRRFARARPWLIAASLVIAAGTTLLIRARSTRETTTRLASTVAGERLVVHLSDSSVVTLGPATTMRFVATATRRSVELDGLADFRVVHDEARPFVVRARDAQATDVGTEFVVRAYPGDSSVRVAVTSGIVSLVNVTGSRPAVTLRAGDLGTVRGTALPTVQPGNASAFNAWVGGQLTFDDAPLTDVVADLARWFDADIRIDDASLARRHVTGVYNDPTLTAVLDALSATLGARIVRSGHTITLRAGGR